MLCNCHQNIFAVGFGIAKKGRPMPLVFVHSYCLIYNFSLFKRFFDLRVTLFNLIPVLPDQFPDAFG